MTERIRWGHDEPGDGVILDGSTGSVGTLPLAAFHIWKAPQYGGELVLTSDLPGQEGKRSFGTDPDELKATAERWLSEFISSLGAIFPDEPYADPDCAECGFGLPRHDKDCSYYREPAKETGQ